MRAAPVVGLLALVAACATGDAAQPASEPPADRPLGQRLRRLGARELAAAVRDLTGVGAGDRLAPLARHGAYDNGDPDTWITADVLAAIDETAWRVADEVIRTRAPRVFDGCDRADTCKRQLLDVVVPRIFRRELTGGEIDAFRGLWDGSAEPDFLEAVRAVLAAALESPAFLYREEIGRVDDRTTIALLEPHEIATQLAFLVTGSTPDDELLAASRDDRLLAADVRVAHLTRLAATPAARTLERHFLSLYLATGGIDRIAKSAAAYPAFDGAALARDLDRFLDGVVAAGGSAAELLRHADTVAAAGYGENPPVRGVLLHPAFLAAHGGFDHSNPVARGVFVLANLLCSTPAPPPAGIPRVPKTPAQHDTTRARFAAHTEGSCQRCHAAIDGIGFGFEHFDGAGHYRTTENGKPIDASGRATFGSSLVSYTGAAELAERLAQSSEVADCYGRHVTRFALGGGERVEDAMLYDALANGALPSASYVERIRRIVASDTFVRRRTR